jgi:hypothetical protein
MARGVNKIVREVTKGAVFEDATNVIDSTVSFLQGDLLVFDDTANLLKVPSAESEGSTFLGIARVDVVSGHIRGAYEGLTDVDASVAAGAIPGPVYGVEAKVVLKTGDSIAPGDLVYLDPASGTRNVKVAGSKAIGVYQGATISGAAAGTEVVVKLGTRFPADTLRGV